jgi:membrane associated rhomboid family serine protease
VTESPQEKGPVRDRLISALADPEVASRLGFQAAALIAVHEPMTVFEWIGAGKGLVMLEYDKIPASELSGHIERILAAHEKGLLFVAVAGGGGHVADALRTADAESRNRDHLGLYHIDDSGKVDRVAGRRLRELEKAGRALPAVPSLSTEDIAAIVERGRRERLDAMEFVRGNVRRFPHLTVGIIAVCVLMYAATSGHDPRAEHLYQLLQNTPDGVRQGQLWRVLTYALLHDIRAGNNATHLIVNMLSLYSLGTFLEPMLGRARFGILCAIAAVAGGVASTLGTHAPSVGASGVVWGLVGATLGLLQGRHKLFPALIARSLRQRLIVILAINVAISFLPGIDRYCHFGGGIAGYALARWFARKPMRKSA